MRRTTRKLALVLVLLAVPLTATAQEPVIPRQPFLKACSCLSTYQVSMPLSRGALRIGLPIN